MQVFKTMMKTVAPILAEVVEDATHHTSLKKGMTPGLGSIMLEEVEALCDLRNEATTGLIHDIYNSVYISIQLHIYRSTKENQVL